MRVCGFEHGEGLVVFGLLAELGFDGVDHRVQLVEVAVVQAETLCELSSSFDGIESGDEFMRTAA